MHKANTNSIESLHRDRRLTSRLETLAATLLAVCVGCATPLQAGPSPHADAPPDAVIEVWEQHWTLNQDGSTEYHNKQHVRLNNDRSYDEFADPRITYNVDTDELQIINARVKRADGTYRELQDYSHVFVSPDESAGWPAFAAIRQHLVVLGGIEPGCLAELEFRIRSKPGTRPYVAADLRLTSHYPILKRVVSVATPTDVEVTYKTSGPAKDAEPQIDARDGMRTLRWQFEHLPAVPHESASPPWQTGCPRLSFSSAGDAEAWFKKVLAQIEDAADESELISKAVEDWIEDQREPSDKLRALQEKLAGTFNFVDFPVAWRPARPRPASEVFDTSYGLPREAAAVLLALARAADLPAAPGVLCANHEFVHEAPQCGMVANYVVVLDGPQPEIWDAHHGRIVRDAHWAGYNLMWYRGGELQHTALPAWTAANDSRCDLHGKVTLKDDGTYDGELTLRTSGLFVSVEQLSSNGSQKGRIERMLDHVLPGARVESFSIERLSDHEFVASAKIKSGEALEKQAECYELAFAGSGPFSTEIDLPLSNGHRKNAVWLAGPFDQQVQFEVEWPEKWTIEAVPGSVERVEGKWGAVVQQVATDDHSLTLRRHTRVNQRSLPADEFLVLRAPLNEMHSDYARLLMLKP